MQTNPVVNNAQAAAKPSSLWKDAFKRFYRNKHAVVALVVLTSVGIGLYSPLLWSMYADVADYATEKNGTSSTGLIFSSGTMAQKFGTAISGSLVALFLGLAGASMITDEMGNTMVDPASITSSVLSMVWSLFSLFPAIIAGLIIVLTWIYPIKK